jgi:hypothetical protein
METYYTAYTKLLDFKTYYFVKKFTSFPELKNVAPVMNAYGMHTDFDRACSIAGVTDADVKATLLEQAKESRPTAKVFALNPTIMAAAVTG